MCKCDENLEMNCEFVSMDTVERTKVDDSDIVLNNLLEMIVVI
jgi:hypothetical protein